MNKENLKFYLVFLFALILGILVDYLFYGKPVGISFFVFISIFIIFSLILAKKFGQKLTKIQYALLIPIILFSIMVFYRSTPFLIFFNAIGTLFLISLFFALFSKNLLDFTFIKYFISPFSFLIKSFGKSARFIEENINKIEAKKKFRSPKFRSIVRGVIISIPILTLLTWLLSSADIVFQKYLDRLLKVSIDPEIVFRILIVLVASYFFIGIFAKAFTNSEKSKNSLIEKNQLQFLGPIESSVILGAVGLLFLVFISIQFVYLFDGREYVWGIEEYITYSEYARKGFGELIAVSIISFLLIYGIDKFAKRESVFQEQIFKILSNVLVLELFVIMASAFKRLSLYVDGYGYTFSRLLGFIFLFWLFFIFLIFLYKIFLEQKETHFIFSLFWLTILFWAGINFLNPDEFIAKKNINRYVQGKQIDIQYFGRLSEDAVPEVVKIFKVGNEKTKSEVACYLAKQKENLSKYTEVQPWQSFNLSKRKALEVFQKHFKEIEKYKIIYRKLLKEQYPDIDETFYNQEWSVCLPLKK